MAAGGGRGCECTHAIKIRRCSAPRHLSSLAPEHPPSPPEMAPWCHARSAMSSSAGICASPAAHGAGAQAQACRQQQLERRPSTAPEPNIQHRAAATLPCMAGVLRALRPPSCPARCPCWCGPWPLTKLHRLLLHRRVALRGEQQAEGKPVCQHVHPILAGLHRRTEKGRPGRRMLSTTEAVDRWIAACLPRESCQGRAAAVWSRACEGRGHTPTPSLRLPARLLLPPAPPCPAPG